MLPHRKKRLQNILLLLGSSFIGIFLILSALNSQLDLFYSPSELNKNNLPKERIKLGLSFTPGMKVGYIVTDASSSPMKVKSWLVDELDSPPPDYDSEYYAKRLAKALGRITEAFNWSEKELLSGSRQQSLFDF